MPPVPCTGCPVHHNRHSQRGQQHIATVTQGQLQLTAITPDGGFSRYPFQTVVQPRPRYLKVCPNRKNSRHAGGCTGYRHSDGIEQGFSTDSVQLTQLRLLVVATWKNAGCNWRAVKRTACRRHACNGGPVPLHRKQPELATAARRNGISNPLFVPGGVSIEVLMSNTVTLRTDGRLFTGWT